MNLHPITKKKLTRQYSINAVKDGINLLEECQNHWLIKLYDYDKTIQQFAKALNLPDNIEESMIAKYRSKVKENESRNVKN